MLEEVDDIDDMDFDPSDFDPRKVLTAASPRPSPSASSSATSNARPPAGGPSARPVHSIPGPGQMQFTQDPSMFKEWQVVYPVYFDARRTHQEGRRVNKELAVENPLAKTVADACASLRIQVFFEPQKVHPKDWSNPGRVRVLLKDPDTKLLLNPSIKNKRHLYREIACYLKDHATKPEDPLKLPIPGLPNDKPPEKPAVPRGWKINDVLPLHSCALTGGGVSDNIFKDMGGGMGLPGLEGLANGKLPPGLANLPGGLKGLEGMGGLNALQQLGGLEGLGGLGGLGGTGGLRGLGGMGGASGSGGRGVGRKLRK